MPDHMVPPDFDLKLEEISMKIFETTTKKRSKLRTSYRTDFSKSPTIITNQQFGFNDSYTYNDLYNDQVMFSLTKLAEFSISNNAVSVKKSKKSVRFADSLGQSISTIYNIFLYPCEDPDLLTETDSDVSTDSFTDTDSEEEELEIDAFEFSNVRSKWKCCFEQPGLNATFYRDLDTSRILLETIHANHHILEGIVRVVNFAANKKVSLRYTFDDWKTHADKECDYIKSLNFNHVHTDQFKFEFELNESMFERLLEENKYLNSTNEPFFKVQFALCYDTFHDEARTDRADTYWDNNALKNYCFECYLQMIS